MVCFTNTYDRFLLGILKIEQERVNTVLADSEMLCVSKVVARESSIIVQSSPPNRRLEPRWLGIPAPEVLRRSESGHAHYRHRRK